MKISFSNKSSKLKAKFHDGVLSAVYKDPDAPKFWQWDAKNGAIGFELSDLDGFTDLIKTGPAHERTTLLRFRHHEDAERAMRTLSCAGLKPSFSWLRFFATWLLIVGVLFATVSLLQSIISFGALAKYSPEETSKMLGGLTGEVSPPMTMPDMGPATAGGSMFETPTTLPVTPGQPGAPVDADQYFATHR